MGWEKVGNVKGPPWSGIVDVSKLTTAAAINAATLAAGDGAIVWWGGKVFPFVAEDTLIVRPYQEWVGAGGRGQITRIQAGPSFTAGKPLLAAQGYMNNASLCDGPVNVHGFLLDLNFKSQSHGFCPFNYWSRFDDIQIINASGGNAHGLHVSDKSYNGSNIATNSFSENTFNNFRFSNFLNGAGAFFQESNNGVSNQDGHFTNSFFSGIGGHAMEMNRIAGWSVVNNHFYGIGKDCIRGAGGYASKVQDNYIEDWGNENAAGGYYTAISLAQLDTRASKISGNTISFRQPHNLVTDAILTPAAARWTGIYVEAGWGQAQAKVLISDNELVWADNPPPSSLASKCWAVDMNCNSNGTPTPKLQCEYSNNLIDNLASPMWGKKWNVHANTTLPPDYRRGVSPVAGGTSLALDCEIHNRDVTWTPSAGTANISIPAPIDAKVDGDTYTITVIPGSTARNVALSGMGLLTGITSPIAVPANKKMRALLRYCAADSSWTVEAAAVQQ